LWKHGRRRKRSPSENSHKQNVHSSSGGITEVVVEMAVVVAIAVAVVVVITMVVDWASFVVVVVVAVGFSPSVRSRTGKVFAVGVKETSVGFEEGVLGFLTE
jgi:hypothetical protein